MLWTKAKPNPARPALVPPRPYLNSVNLLPRRRFFNLRLERNAQALNKLQNCHGIPGLIGVQQEWIRDLVEDYMGQNLRLAGTMRDLTQNVMASATETASGHIDRMQQDASDIVHHAGEQINQMAQSVNEHAPETQH
jgi:hypothetical protein